MEQNMLSASFINTCQFIPFCRKNSISQTAGVIKCFFTVGRKKKRKTMQLKLLNYTAFKI